jgi:hypothetical protein
MTAPPDFAIQAAIEQANRSPCAKSKRGVAIWLHSEDDDRPHGPNFWGDEEFGPWQLRSRDTLLSVGFNGQPPGFTCDGSDECRANCGTLAEHAEIRAIRLMSIGRCRADGRPWDGVEMLHVKTVDGQLVPSGGPSCWQCSRTIAADERISAMWLFHEEGWRRYAPTEFHELTLKACGLPVLRGGHGP